MNTSKFEARLPQVRVTPALKQALEARAAKDGIRVNDAVRQAIVEYLNRVKVPIVGEIRPGPAGPIVFIHDDNFNQAA